jgi:hypothetical protein
MRSMQSRRELCGAVAGPIFWGRPRAQPRTEHPRGPAPRTARRDAPGKQKGVPNARPLDSRLRGMTASYRSGVTPSATRNRATML